jgi:rhomboid protease GluP
MNEEPSTPPQAATNEAPATEPGPEAALREFDERLAQRMPRVFVTWALLALNFLVFGLMVATGVSLLEPSSEDLMKWGMDHGPSALREGQAWRLLSSAFVHIGPWHLGLNMLGLWLLGRRCERLYGHLTFTFIYLLSALGGSLASIAWRPLGMSAGASGALFGLAGAFLAFLYLRPDALPPEALRKLRGEVLGTIALNLLFGFSMGFVDNAAHLGGLITGALAGALVTREVPGGVAPPRLARLWGVLMLLVGAAGVAKWRVDTQPEVAGMALFQEAAGALAAEDYARTVELMTRGLEQMPDDALSWSIRGLAYAHLGRKAEAYDDYTRALQLDPEESEALLYRCMLGNESKDVEVSFADCTRAITSDPHRAYLAHLGRASILMGKGDLQEAEADYTRALELYPQNVQVLAARGDARSRLGRLDEALADFDAALAIEPENAVLHNNRAWALLVAGRSQEALTGSERAVALAPRSAYALGTRCWVRADLGDTAGALEDCRAALAQDAGELLNAGMLQWLLGQPAEALATWERALKKSPHERHALERWMERARRATTR